MSHTFESSSLRDLLASYCAIIAELKRRKVVRTDNAPAGDYAEYLVCKALAGMLAPNSERSFDLTAPTWGRVQVKCRVTDASRANPRSQLSPFRSFDFDVAAVVLLNSNYSVRRAVLVPVATIREVSHYREHVNGYVVHARKALLDTAGNADITDLVSAAASVE